eukprot:m.1430320 g.1430320  ORF g.1430320 m.1430320 type:complete len:1775 (-) comp25073_c0_seq5:163-5487(-)
MMSNVVNRRASPSSAGLDRERRRSLYVKQRKSGVFDEQLEGLVFTDGQSHAGDDGDSTHTGTDDHMVAADNIGSRDLATLVTLNEDSILEQLSLRYSRDVIYTNVGDILIAVNPFKEIPGLYSDAVALEYFHDKRLNRIPHVYRVSQRAYKTLLMSHKHQCCVISGESGSGKTETAKFLVGHLLSMCKGTGTLEQQILQVNPLLEAFGNACTVINDNSSRFGKYLDIKFGFFGDVLGASLSEYLLEKSRVVRQGDGERNFHVFYYLFSSHCAKLREACQIDDPTTYHYLRGGLKGITRDGAIDISEDELDQKYAGLHQCMTDVGFSAEESTSVFELLAYILHLGSIEFTEGDNAFSEIVNPAPVDLLASFLMVDREELGKVLTSTSSVMRGERIYTFYNVLQAFDNRDAIAKAMYGRLFAWIVSQANDLLAPRGKAYREARGREGGVTNVGILDIFGFENFVVNSFEQLCINVANEQLQFYFNQHIFAWELATYAKEGIDAGQVSFKDNQALLDMVLSKPLGIFALLDEESRFPKATADSLVDKIEKARVQCDWIHFQRCNTAARKKRLAARSEKGVPARIKNAVQATRAESDTGPYFDIVHFAGTVTYDACQFLPKNRDPLSADVLALFKVSDNEFLQGLFLQKMSRTGTYGAGASRSNRRKKDPSKLSVSAHFKNSLLDLMDKMLAAQPHFIRCIKPNRTKQPQKFLPKEVHQQLLYAGVVETTRIRRDGYAIRMKFADFLRRYSTLGLKCYEVPTLDPADDEPPATDNELRVACTRVVEAAGIRGVQLGTTMVFLKYYHAETLLELIERQHAAATRLQALARRGLAMRRVAAIREDMRLAAIAAAEAAERERRAKELAERIERERKAAEEAERQAQLAAEQAALRAETLKRDRQREAEKAAQRAAAVAQAAREKAARLEQEAQDEARETALRDEERRVAEAAKQEAAQRAEAEKVARRQRQQQEFSQQQKLAKEKARQSAAAYADEEAARLAASSPTKSAMMTPASTFGADLDDDEDDAFAEVFADEDLSAEEREKLAALAGQRRADEIRRKQELKAQHALEEQRRADERMRELNAIAAREAKLAEEREREAAIDASAAMSRIDELDFGSFSFGAPAAVAPKADPKPPTPKEIKREPAKSTKKSKKPMLNIFGSKKSRRESKESIEVPAETTSTRSGGATPGTVPAVTAAAPPTQHRQRSATVTSTGSVSKKPPPPVAPRKSISLPQKPKGESRKFAAGSKKAKPLPPPPAQLLDAATLGGDTTTPPPPPPPEEESPPRKVSSSTSASVNRVNNIPAPATETTGQLSLIQKKNKGALPSVRVTTSDSGSQDSLGSGPPIERVCTIKRTSEGNFGLGISTFDRMSGCRVSKVATHITAAGLCLNDVIVEVDGLNVSDKGHDFILGLIKNAGAEMKLKVLRHQGERRPTTPSQVSLRKHAQGVTAVAKGSSAANAAAPAVQQPPVAKPSVQITPTMAAVIARRKAAEEAEKKGGGAASTSTTPEITPTMAAIIARRKAAAEGGDAAVAAAAANPPRKPRRKLVRGGNRNETPVLPEYQAMLDAIADLDRFLDAYETNNGIVSATTSADDAGSTPSSATLQVESTGGGAALPPTAVRTMERDMDTRGRPSKLAQVSPSGINALENVLMIGSSTGSHADSGQDRNSNRLSAEANSKFLLGAEKLTASSSALTNRDSVASQSSTRRNRLPTLAGGASTSKGGVNIKGYLLSADDVLSMDEKERVALLERVKSGNMSIDEALQEVIEHQRRQNCTIM